LFVDLVIRIRELREYRFSVDNIDHIDLNYTPVTGNVLYTEDDCQTEESVHGTGSNPWIRYVSQCTEAERAQKEADRALERETATIAVENEAKKAKIEAETEKAKVEAEKMTAENERLKIEAQKEIEMAKISAQRESETEARRNKIEATRLEIENQLQVTRLESEVQIRTSSSAGSIEH